MAEDHGASETGQLPRVRSWTEQNEMRGVLGRVSAVAAGRILDSANPREIRSLTEGCVRCSEDEREHSDGLSSSLQLSF